MGITSVLKNGRTCWQVQVIRDGKRIRRYLDRKRYLRQDAAALERELLAELDAARGECLAPAVGGAVVPPAPVMFAVFAERYLALQDPARSDHGNKARDVRLHLIPALGDRPLRAVNRAAIDDLRVALRQPTRATTGSRIRLRSPKTINNILATLRSILDLAYDYELIDRVPRIQLERESGEHRSWRRLYREVGLAAKRAGIARRVHPHDLRHTFASHCYIRGIAPQLVQRWLGHSSVTTTERYAHLRVDEATSKSLESVFPRAPAPTR